MRSQHPQVTELPSTQELPGLVFTPSTSRVLYETGNMVNQITVFFSEQRTNTAKEEIFVSIATLIVFHLAILTSW
jgi:hypothetical protein